MYRPKKCKGGCKMKMQRAGLFYEQQQREEQRQQINNIAKSLQIPPEEATVPPPDMSDWWKPQQNRIEEGVNKGIITAPVVEGVPQKKWYEYITDEPEEKEKKKYSPDTLRAIGLSMMALRTGVGEIAGRVERGRQNRFDWMNQASLGQLNPMPTDDFQPNPYSLYAKYGGNLKNVVRDFNKWSNDADMDMTEGYGPKGVPPSKMKKGGYEIDRMLITRKLLPELLKLGRMKKSYYEEGGEVEYSYRPKMKKGGIYIKPENRGKFTEYCDGKVTEECIEKGLNSPSAAIRKRANFARNVRKWNHEEGGMTEVKKGGLTPNKAREILHDGTAHGKPLTDKQRRFFGAKSKGHTNYRGK